MQDFLLNRHDRAFRAELRRFLADTLAPAAAGIERDDDPAAATAVVAAFGRAGYLRLLFPDHYRGALEAPGLTHVTILSEEISYLNYAVDAAVGAVLSAAFVLHRYARSEIQDRWLPPLLDGEVRGAVAVSEPDAGSDTGALRTQVRRDSRTGEWVVRGLKRYIADASLAEVYIVYGVEQPEAPPPRRLTAVLVPAGTPGLSFPRTYKLVGRRGSVVGDVQFDDCRVPAAYGLGEPGEGARIMRSMFNFERIKLGGGGLGMARAAFDLALEHARQRDAFGQKLAAKQLIWSSIAEMSLRIEAAELLVHRAAKLYDSGVPQGAIAQEASMAKLAGTELANFCADTAVQILGGAGICRELSRGEQLYRDARALKIVGGTSEMQRYLIASSHLKGLRLNL